MFDNLGGSHYAGQGQTTPAGTTKGSPPRRPVTTKTRGMAGSGKTGRAGLNSTRSRPGRPDRAGTWSATRPTPPPDRRTIPIRWPEPARTARPGRARARPPPRRPPGGAAATAGPGTGTPAAAQVPRLCHPQARRGAGPACHRVAQRRRTLCQRRGPGHPRPATARDAAGPGGPGDRVGADMAGPARGDRVPGAPARRRAPGDQNRGRAKQRARAS